MMTQEARKLPAIFISNDGMIAKGIHYYIAAIAIGSNARFAKQTSDRAACAKYAWETVLKLDSMFEKPDDVPVGMLLSFTTELLECFSKEKKENFAIHQSLFTAYGCAFLYDVLSRCGVRDDDALKRLSYKYWKLLAERFPDEFANGVKEAALEALVCMIKTISSYTNFPISEDNIAGCWLSRAEFLEEYNVKLLKEVEGEQ